MGVLPVEMCRPACRPVVLKVGSTLLEELHGTDASVNMKWWRWAWLTGDLCTSDSVCFMSGHDSLHVASSSSSLVKKKTRQHSITRQHDLITTLYADVESVICTGCIAKVSLTKTGIC